MSRSFFTILSLVLFLMGSFVLFSSAGWGSEAANAYLRSQGGGMDGEQFVIVFQEYISMYQWMGSILAVIGGFGLVRAVELR